MENELTVERIQGMTEEEICCRNTALDIVYLEVDDNDIIAATELVNAARKRLKALNATVKPFDDLLAACHTEIKRFQERKRREAREAHLEFKRAVAPEWLTDDDKINEPAFCEFFKIRHHGICCVNGLFYDEGGAVENDKIKHEITESLSSWLKSDLAKKTENLFRTMANVYRIDPPKPDANKIHVQNGFYTVQDSTFHDQKEFTLNRLNVRYEPNAPKPEQWLRYLGDLLHPEDIPTLQEYIGYCLIPSTKAQKMLFLIGNGGEGKSQLGNVLHDIFGNSMVTGSLHDLEENRFALATLEGKLLFLDDDLSTNACKESKNQKKLVTAGAPLSIERKGVQQYETLLYTRLLAFGNVPQHNLYDHSDGVYRRRIILTTKEKPADRLDDPFITEKLLAEKEGILLWALEGLHRLISNAFRLTVSDRARENLEQSRKENCNVIAFLEDEDWVSFSSGSSETSSDIYYAYMQWCNENAEHILARQTTLTYLKRHAEKYGLRFSYHVGRTQAHRGARGFQGIHLKNRVQPTI